MAKPSKSDLARVSPLKSTAISARSQIENTSADVSWEGDSREVLHTWPKPVRTDFGLAITEMQYGRPATLDVRPMPSVGKNVFELKTEDEATWYRLMYIARIDDVIYVLDCFEKDTRRTEKKDLARSEARYKQVQQRLREGRKNAKHNQGREQAGARHKG